MRRAAPANEVLAYLDKKDWAGLSELQIPQQVGRRDPRMRPAVECD